MKLQYKYSKILQRQ